MEGDVAMFDRMAQVNATFPSGSVRKEELVRALVEVGLTEHQVTVIDKVDSGDWREKSAAPGLLARLFGRGAATEAAEAPATTAVLVHLGADESLADQVEAELRRLGATNVDRYAAGRIQTRSQGQDVVSKDDEGTLFDAAFPDQERRSPRS